MALVIGREMGREKKKSGEGEETIISLGPTQG